MYIFVTIRCIKFDYFSAKTTKLFIGYNIKNECF